jgi:hypothetical protein
MAHHFITSVKSTDTGLVFPDSLQITKSRFAMRTVFRPFFVKVGDDLVTDPAKGWYAEIAAPEAANIGSIAVALKDTAATGVMSLSVINPVFSYNGFFLYTFIDDILPTPRGSLIYRKTEVHNGSYSTLTFTEGKLYALILDGPDVPEFTWTSQTADAVPSIPASVAITADTI